LTLDEPKKNEIGYNVNGLDVLIEEKVKPYAEGNTVDFVNGPQGQGFTIVKEGAGGCGDSCGGSCH
jgi:Fe-S cluster assembly iron-binding protein IscA